VHYYFLKKEEFEEKINNDEFLEYADVFGNYYGTLKSQIEEKFQNGKDVFLDIDYQGAEKITEKIDKKKLLKIFIVPPSMEELKRRLIERGRDKAEDIEKRLSKAKLEMKQSINYDYVVVNDNFDETVQNIKSIIQAKRIKNSEGRNLNEFIENF
jgi:guanylate kinase